MVSRDNSPQPGEASEATKRPEPTKFDESAEYFPVFCLSDNIPEEYFTLLQSHTTEVNLWMEITTSDPYSESILAQSKAAMNSTPRAHPPRAPFLDWNLPALYEFHKTLLRPLLTLEGRGSHFAYFPFLAVDAACVQSPNPNDWEIIVCSDAPDFGENPETGPRLKVFRVPVAEAMDSALCRIETLTATPTEVGKRSALSLRVQPPPMGPPPAAREYKWNVLAGLPEPEGEGVVEVLEV